MARDETNPFNGADCAEALDMAEVASRVCAFTQQLLKDGANASDVAFALTTVAADMGLQVTGDALQVIPVLMDAIALQAKRRLEAKDKEDPDDDAGAADMPTKGTTVH